MSPKEMAEVFDRWNKGPLDSYLVEITRDVLAFDDDDGDSLLEKILDSAGQKVCDIFIPFEMSPCSSPVPFQKIEELPQSGSFLWLISTLGNRQMDGNQRS